MKYNPKPVDTQVNLPTRHPLVDMAWLLGGLALITIVLYVITGWLINVLVDRIPSSFDNSVSADVNRSFSEAFGSPKTDGKYYDATKKLFDELRAILPADDEREYTLIVIDDPMVNAAAAPGGIIVVFTGLLKEVESENELAMVLAHEFGHSYHKHHWKRLGRGILFGVAMAATLGKMDAFQANLTSTPLTALQRSYDRSKESESDRFAIELICKYYGHSGGAQDFFARHVGQEGLAAKFTEFLTTHPLSQSRVDDINKWSNELACPQGDVRPFVVQ